MKDLTLKQILEVLTADIDILLLQKKKQELYTKNEIRLQLKSSLIRVIEQIERDNFFYYTPMNIPLYSASKIINILSSTISKKEKNILVQNIVEEINSFKEEKRNKNSFFFLYLCRKKNHTNIMEYPISLDTALQIVGSLKVRAINELENVKTEKEKVQINQKIDMYLQEERMLYGTDDLSRLSVMDKVVNFYSPLIKRLNGFA